MLISSSDFINWKQDPVTTVVMNHLNARMNKRLLELSGGPRSDLDIVNWYRGYIAALDDVLSMEPFELEEVADA